MENIYYLVYQITNLINEKIYVGCHSTRNKNDNYMGSGNAIKKAIKKYGRENFKKEILKECNSPQEMLDKEKEIVNKEFVARLDTYNMMIGGVWDNRKDKSKSEEYKDKLRGKKRTDETKKKMQGKVPVINSEGRRFKVLIDDPRYLSGELTHTSIGRKNTKESLKKMSEKAKGRKVSTETKEKIKNTLMGKGNHFYGKVHTDESKLKMSKSRKGIPKPPFSEEHKKNLSLNKIGKKWITSSDFTTLKQVGKEELQNFLDLGWVLGNKKQKVIK